MYPSDKKRTQKIEEIEDFVRDSMTFTGWDIVLAISCDGWPSCAKEWITQDLI